MYDFTDILEKLEEYNKSKNTKCEYNAKHDLNYVARSFFEECAKEAVKDIKFSIGPITSSEKW